MHRPARAPGARGRARVRHLTGPGAPPWYVRHERVLLLAGIVLFAALAHQLRRSFRGETSFSPVWPVLRGRHAYTYDLGFVLFTLVAAVVLARRRIIGAVRVRVRALDDVHARGWWWAAGVTGALNVVYVLAIVGPGRWAAAEAYTAYAVGSEHFLAADEVVAQAVVRYFDRGTALALVAMVVEAALFQAVTRGRRRYGVAD